MMTWILAAVIGGVLGHLVRRLTPFLLRMKETKMPFGWPWLEVCGALVLSLLAVQKGLGLDFFRWTLFIGLLLAVTSADFLLKLIPDSISVGGTFLGLICGFAFPNDIAAFLGQARWLNLLGLDLNSPGLLGLVLAFSGAMTGLLMMELIRRIFSRMVGMQVMGFGDSCLMMMIGSFLGPQMVVVSLIPACLVGVAMGGIYKLKFGTPHSPFGPALALGSVAMLLYSRPILHFITGYQDFLSDLSPVALMIFSLALLVSAGLLILRIKHKRDEYERQIEGDYEEIEEKIKP